MKCERLFTNLLVKKLINLEGGILQVNIKSCNRGKSLIRAHKKLKIEKNEIFLDLNYEEKMLKNVKNNTMDMKSEGLISVLRR